MINFKKMISSILVVVLIIPLFLNENTALANENTQSIPPIESEVLDNGIAVDIIHEDIDSVSLETNHTTGELDIDIDIEMDKETEEIYVSGDVTNEDGSTISQNFEVIVHESEGEVFIATFIDTETGEIIDIDTTVFQASAIPLIIIAAVARFGIQYAIKKYGKKAAQNAIKGKSYNTVLSSVKNINANSRSKVLAKKHLWSKVTNNNWTDVSKVLSHVMRYGKESAYGSARKKTLVMSGKTVTVTFKRVNGQTRVSNGWVNK